MSDEAQAPPPGDVAPAADPVPNAVPAAVAPTAEQVSVTSVDGASTTSPSVESSPADEAAISAQKAYLAQRDSAMTFEQRVEERFLAVEHFITELPHSIHSVMGQGSMSAEDFGKAVLAHLFAKK